MERNGCLFIYLFHFEEGRCGARLAAAAVVVVVVLLLLRDHAWDKGHYCNSVLENEWIDGRMA